MITSGTTRSAEPASTNSVLTCSLHAFISRGLSPVKENKVTPRRSQAERRAATRGAIVDSARRLFAERGFAGVGREEIVRAAGVTRGAMYHYFDSKEELFREVYEAIERDLTLAIVHAAGSDPDPVEQLRLGTRAFLQAASKDEVRRVVLVDAPAVLAPAVRKELSEQYGLGLVREGLDAIASAGRLRVGSPEILAPILLAAMHEAATRIADNEPADEVIEVVDELLRQLTVPTSGLTEPVSARPRRPRAGGRSRRP